MDEQAFRCGTRRIWSATPCAARPAGHRTLSRPPETTRAGQLGDEGPHDARRLARLVAQRLGDEVAGTGGEECVDREASPVPVTRRALGTHTLEGPSPIVRHCPNCRVGAVSGSRPTSRAPARNPCHCGNPSFLWMTDPRSVEGRPRIPVEPGNVPECPCGRVLQGIELLPRTPARESGTVGDEDPARSDRQLAGSVRGGRMTRPPGPETRTGSSGSVTSTGHTKGPWNSYSRGAFTFVRHPSRHPSPETSRPREPAPHPAARPVTTRTSSGFPARSDTGSSSACLRGPAPVVPPVAKAVWRPDVTGARERARAPGR